MSPFLLRPDALIFDLFHEKLDHSRVFEEAAHPSKGEGAAAVFRVDPSVPFTQLGLDSLDLVELMVATEKDFHIELEDQEHAQVKTVDDIITLIHQHPNAY